MLFKAGLTVCLGSCFFFFVYSDFDFNFCQCYFVYLYFELTFPLVLFYLYIAFDFTSHLCYFCQSRFWFLCLNSLILSIQIKDLLYCFLLSKFYLNVIQDKTVQSEMPPPKNAHLWHRAPENVQVQRVITPYFWKWWVFAYFLCTVVLSTSEKIAYMYTLKIMFDTSVIQ